MKIDRTKTRTIPPSSLPVAAFLALFLFGACAPAGERLATNCPVGNYGDVTEYKRYSPACKTRLEELLGETKEPGASLPAPNARTETELATAPTLSTDAYLNEVAPTREERVAIYREILESGLYNINAAVMAGEIVYKCYEDSFNKLMADYDDNLIPPNETLYFIYEIQDGLGNTVSVLNDYKNVASANISAMGNYIDRETPNPRDKNQLRTFEGLKMISENARTGTIRAAGLANQYNNLMKVLQDAARNFCLPSNQTPGVSRNITS
ncbi:MAG: hypothetical protein LBF41_07370 [Deltaproteobacteria bacterium]|jgi:hypothetical protein|nr:hypothetical protein [Deltaproteobacteria bacterium]